MRLKQGLVDDFRTFGWKKFVKYPETAYQKSGNYLQLSSMFLGNYKNI